MRLGHEGGSDAAGECAEPFLIYKSVDAYDERHEHAVQHAERRHRNAGKLGQEVYRKRAQFVDKVVYRLFDDIIGLRRGGKLFGKLLELF